MSESINRTNLLRMVADIAAAYVSNNSTPASDVPNIIRSVYGSLSALNAKGTNASESTLRPAVPIRKSVTPDYIVCLEDGKKLKMLKRHLRTSFGLTPEAYKTKWGLPSDYPIVAPNYAAKRSAFAKKIGLGRKPGKKRKT